MCPHPAHLLTLMSAVNDPIPPLLPLPRLALKCPLCLGPVPRPARDMVIIAPTNVINMIGRRNIHTVTRTDTTESRKSRPQLQQGLKLGFRVRALVKVHVLNKIKVARRCREIRVRGSNESAFPMQVSVLELYSVL